MVIQKALKFAINDMRIFLAILLLLCFKLTYGQESKNRLLNEIENCITTNSKAIKDSAAIYCFALHIEVKVINKKTIISNIFISYSLANILNVNYVGLKKLNFKPLVLNNKSINIILPIGITVIKYQPSKITRLLIPIEEFSKKIQKLFYYSVNDKNNPEKYIYLKPLLINIDKTIYD